MAPFDRRPERSLTFGGIARATREERQGAIEALQESLRAEELRSCSGELDRKRQAVQTETDRLDRGARCQVLSDAAGSFQKQGHRICRRQRLERKLLLPGHPQRRPARHEHAQPVSGGEKRRDVGNGREKVLEVVEQEQQLLSAQIAEQVVAGRQRSRDLRQHELGIRQTGERNPEHSVRKRADQLGRDLQSEARLARPARAGDGDQARALREQRHDLPQLQLPARGAGSPLPEDSSHRACEAEETRRRRADRAVRERSGPSGDARPDPGDRSRSRPDRASSARSRSVPRGRQRRSVRPDGRRFPHSPRLRRAARRCELRFVPGPRSRRDQPALRSPPRQLRRLA